MATFRVIWSLLRLQCPNCRETPMFSNPNLFNLAEIHKMPEKCPNCAQDFWVEPGFYYGAMYMSYIVGAIVLFFVLGVSLLLYGSVSRTYMYTTLAISVLFWTYLFRISRVLWLQINLWLFNDKE